VIFVIHNETMTMMHIVENNLTPRSSETKW